MIVTWLFVAAAVFGQTTQPAEQADSTPVAMEVATTAPAEAGVAPAQRRVAPRITVAVPSTQPEPRESVQIKTQPPLAGLTTQPSVVTQATQPAFGAPPSLTGDIVNVQTTEQGIVVSGNPEDIRFIQSIISALDMAVPAEFQIFPLTNTTATDVAPNLEKLWNEAKKRAAGRIAPEDRLTVIPESRSNVLMVATTKENMDSVAKLVRELDKSPFGGDMQWEPIQLSNIKAAEAEKSIQDLLGTLAKQRKIDTQLVNIKTDIRTNRLLVAAPESDLLMIKRLVALIDVAPTLESGGVVKVGIFPLLKGVAKEMADSLTTMLQANTDASKVAQEQIRRLQVVLHKADGEKALPELDLEKPIKIQADTGTNSVIVQTTEANLKAIDALIKVMDTVPIGEDMMVKVFPLKYADAATLQKNLQDMFSQGPKLPQQPNQSIARVPQALPGSALVYNIGLSSDNRTNTLIVSGRPEQVYLINQIVGAIDVAENPNRFPPRLVKLAHADVKRIQQAIGELSKMRDEMAKRLSPTEQEREKILAIPDERTNSLIIIAKDDNFSEIQELVAKLDTPEDKWLGEIHIIRLTPPLAATDIADKVKSLWERRAEKRTQGGLPADKPVVVADTRTNALVIASNPEDRAAIAKLVGQLQQLPLSPMQDIREIVLKHNDATKLADVVTKIFQERLNNSTGEGQKPQSSEKVYVSAEAQTNTLLVASSKTMYDEVVRLVALLDMQPIQEGTLRTFFVRNTDVTQAATMLKDLFTKGLYRGPGPQQASEAQKTVTVIPDVRSSALIVSASPENLTIVEAVLKDIDRVELPISQASARVIQLHNADVEQVAGQLTSIVEGIKQGLGDQGTQFQIKIIANGRTNSLILSGTRLAMSQIEAIVPTLDQPTERASYETRVYKLAQGSAGQLQQVLTDLMEKRLPATDAKQRTPVVIIPDEAANNLIVSAPRELQTEIGQLIEKLDQPTQLAQRMEIIRLERAKAQAVVDALDKMVKAQQGKGAAQPSFTATADSRTNSVIVFAQPDLMGTVQELVRRLDTTEPKEVMAMRVFRLQNAEADAMSKLLEDFFKQASQAEGKDLRQLIIRFTPVSQETGQPVVEPATGEKVVKTLIHQDITIRPDPYTNSLLVMAPADSIDMMEMLVKMLDSIEPRTVKVQPFELRKADAEEMRKLLQDLFKSTGGKSGQGRSLVLTGEGGGSVAGASVSGAATGGETEVLFAVDRRTNTLVAAGTPAQLKIVESLVYRLDDQEMDERIVRVVPLQYAKSGDIAKTMSAFFKSESSLVQKAEEGAAATRELQREVTIESSPEDSNTNTLLISYSPRIESQVITMINELDRPPPQVMIQVLMAEVTLDDRFEFGMEFALQDLLFSENAYLGNNGVIKGENFDFIGGTDLGASGSGGGVSFTITGADFNYLIRAMQAEGRLEILSRPSLLVQDNKEASIKVGENVPIVEQLNVNQIGTVTPSVTYKDVGVNLELTPIINPDGFVNLKIAPEISALGTSSVSIGGGVTLPIFTQRKAETNVTVKDGETIVIGGLITSRTSESESKVPVMGDIPILGMAFRATSRNQQKTELLMVLTPHVVRNPDEARTMSVEMRDQTGLMDNVRRNPLMQGLQVKPEGDQPCSPEMCPGQLKPETQEEMGPNIEEMGPPTTSIEFGPDRNSMAIAR